MDKLFTDDKKIEKVANVYLEKDSTTWVKSIITNFITDYPQLQGQPVSITWKKKDIAKGYAVGSLNVLNGSIPIIIKNFTVSPLDVLMYGNAAMPLNTETLNELLANADAFKGISNVGPKDSLRIFGDTKVQWSPVDGIGALSESTGTTRDAIKVASIIDSIEHIDKDAVKEIFKEIKDNNLLKQFEANGTSEVLEKLASHTLTSAETTIESFLRELSIDRQYTFEDESGNIFVKQANSNVDYVWTVEVSAQEVPKPLVNATNFEKTASKSCKKVVKNLKVGQKGKFIDKNEKTAEFDIVGVEKLASLQNYAILHNEEENLGLFIDNNGNWSEIDSKFVKVAKSTLDLAGSEPQKGDYGVFVTKTKTTTPFTVDFIEKVAGVDAEYRIHGSNHRGYVEYTPSFVKTGSIQKAYKTDYKYFLPQDTIFVKLAKKLDNTKEIEKLAQASTGDYLFKVNVVENLVPKTYYITNGENSNLDKGEVSINAEFLEEGVEKTAEKLADSNYIGRDTAGLYYIQGEELNKYAKTHSSRDLSKNEAIWAAVHCGANEVEVEKLAELRPGQVLVIENILKAPEKLGSIEHRINENYEKIASEGKFLSKLLVKEAAALQDKSTVDAVLSLGLIRKYNILEFISLVGEYEKVAGELAKLLIMIRMGLTNIPEVPVKTAMDSLSYTATLLRQLQRVNK